MTEAFRVDFEALADDSEKWLEWHGKLAALADVIPLVDGGAMNLAIFSRVARGQDVRRAYDTVSKALVAYLTEGADQAERIGTKLAHVRRIYREADTDNRADIQGH